MATWRAPLSISLSALVIFSGLAYLLVSSGLISDPITQRPSQLPSSFSTTSKHPHKPFRAPAVNPWAELDEVEASQLYVWLQENTDLLDSKRDDGSTSDNTVNLIELLRPNKSDVVAYLDYAGPAPPRWARLSTLETKNDHAFIVEYMVGPLPPSNDTELLPLTYPHNSGRNWIESPISNVFAMLDWALEIGENASDITLALLGAQTNRDDPDDPEGLVIGSRPALLESGRMVHWLEFFASGMSSDARSLLPQGLYVKLDVPSADPTSWRTGQWFYNGVLYENDTMLRQAMQDPEFEQLVINEDGEWTDTENLNTGTIERDTMPPPLSIQPYGPRYHLDRAQNYISWMGFTFYLSTSQATALSLFDINYNSTRLIYHLGLQEALAHYAGVEPLQSGLEFLDTFFGMGKKMFSLVPGVDCPGHAEYIDMIYHAGGRMFTNRNAICVFEFTSDAPLQRHTSAFSATVSYNTYLVVRSVSTVGNYDYTIDYIFYLDGSIEVKLRASGYIFGAFNAEALSGTPPNASTKNEYGYRIHPGLHTSMHDHVVNFRADVDLCGGDINTLVRTSIEPLTRSYAWDLPEVSTPRNTMHMTHTTLTHESGLNWPRNGAEMYLISAPGNVNKWGETRAYRILPGTGMGNPTHLTILNSTALGHSASWSEADLWVLKNHPDDEPSSAHHWNTLDPLDPLVDFAKMANNESLLTATVRGEEEEVKEAEQEIGTDLVIYFNLGGHHVPSSQDVPNTLMHTSASSVLFMPFNYFDDDVSKAVRQGVRIDRSPSRRKSATTSSTTSQNPGDVDDDEKSEIRARSTAKKPSGDEEVTYFGAHYTSPVTVSQEMLAPDLSHYMKERDEGDDTWKTVRNRVGGGLYGLFVGKERGGERDNKDPRMEW